MIVSFEGLSFSGKSTALNYAADKIKGFDNTNAFVMKGPGQINHPGKQQWKDYNHYMHAVLKRIEGLNDDVIILGDRLFTEAVVTEDEELYRRYKCYEQKHVLYFEADHDVLKERGSLTEDMLEMENNYRNYLLNWIDHTKIDTGELSEIQMKKAVWTQIMEWQENGESDFYEKEQQ